MIGKVQTVTRIRLEDYHKHYPEFQFEVIRGYYFDEGRCPILGNVIQKLFYLRVEYKKKKNGIQLVIKLITNSVYGKTIQKIAKTRFVIKSNCMTTKKGDETEFKAYMRYNFNQVKQAVPIGDSKKYLIEKYENVSDQLNYCHVDRKSVV